MKGMVWEGRRIKRCRSAVVLPMDIIETEILCRLPVESLLRFKSVCKPWYSVIKSPNFITAHYHHRSNRNRRRPLLLHQILSTITERVAFDPAATSIDDSDSDSRLPLTLRLVNRDARFNLLQGGNSLYSCISMNGGCILVRPVNGFLLMLITDIKKSERCRMAMLNPATRQFRFLIDFEFKGVYRPLRGFVTKDNHVFGYGICKSNVYKIVWLNIPVVAGTNTPTSVAVAKVYTVGDGGGGGWRIINSDLPPDFVNNYCLIPRLNIFMNGKCYWVSVYVSHILVFDMDKEVFREMKSPVPSTLYSPGYLRDRISYDVMLSEVQGCGGEGEGVSLALFIFGPKFIDMFVMDKEEEWNWTRRILPCVARPVDILKTLVQLQFSIAESILLKVGRDSFVLYNPKANECMRFCQPDPIIKHYPLISVYNFKESLFSVEGGVQVSERMLKDFSFR